MRRLSSVLVASGFSQTTCAPCSSARRVCSTCSTFGVQTCTTSTRSRARPRGSRMRQHRSPPQAVRPRLVSGWTRRRLVRRNRAPRRRGPGPRSQSRQSPFAAPSSSFEEHVRQDLYVQARLLRGRQALHPVHNAVMEVRELPGEALLVGLEDSRCTRPVGPARHLVNGRRLLQPRRGNDSVCTSSAK